MLYAKVIAGVDIRGVLFPVSFHLDGFSGEPIIGGDIA